MTLQIPTEANQYCLREPAHRYWQGGRCVYYFALDLQSLDGLLPQRVDEGMIKDANRRLTPSHAKKIQEYLREEETWLLGSILLGISPKAVEFLPYEDEHGSININFGELRILANRRNTMRIFDGQHRRRAIGDLIQELTDEGGIPARHRESLLQSSVSVSLYEEENLSSLRQMFSDAAKTKKIEANVVTIFDGRYAFNLAARYLAEKSLLFGGRVEMDGTRASASSSSLLAINQLAANLKALDFGINGRLSRARNDEYMRDLDAVYKRCLEWADEFLPAARTEYESLVNGDRDNSEIPAIRKRSLALNPTCLWILAGSYHKWRRDIGDDWTPLSSYLRTANLSPDGNEGALLVNAGVMIPGSSLFGRRQEVQGAINHIVAEAGKMAQ